MAARIPITTSREYLLKAAQLLSKHLDELGLDHAYIGGFAWSLLGSERPTEDIDVMIKVGDDVTDILALRDQLSKLDPHFVSAGIKLYFSQDPVDPSENPVNQLSKKKDNVLVETLLAGSLGLPQIPRPVYDELPIPILHPSILVLTKLKRWAATHESTRPKTIQKNVVDATDIQYMIFWLASNNIKIEFEKYSGKSKDELLALVRKFRAKFADNEDLMAALKAALGEDWDFL